jgi:hypothetical protein
MMGIARIALRFRRLRSQLTAVFNEMSNFAGRVGRKGIVPQPPGSVCIRRTSFDIL